MKFRGTSRFHGLKRPRVRQTWNKYNLYNLSRLGSNPKLRPFLGTFFQQKWAAKSLTRGYHGEHIKEHQWERMFSRRLLSVVNMNPKYMAEYDGSEQASGRGSGRDQGGGAEQEPRNTSTNSTPYMHMTFAPLERRLDVAVWRALFASSARQARQFVIHGAVKVNGKKMKYPGYQLNPGDMFQVDVDRVLFATGRKKEPSLSAPKRSSGGEEEVSEDAAETEAADESAEGAAAEESTEEPLDDAAASEKERQELKTIRDRVKTILKDPSNSLSAKQKQALRGLSRDVKTVMSRLGKRNPDLKESTSAVDNLATLLSTLELESSKGAAKPAVDDAPAEQDGGAALTPDERDRLDRLLAEEAENPYDPSKPYMTPWRPRPYMAPFAFIPRYLEVNQKICAAVYLRHPVARAGSAEVPTPFPYEISQLAFNWYLRRR